MSPAGDPAGGRTILHVDMDAFFVAVELLDRPELRGQPVIVGGEGPRGVVAAASYEARAYGVGSAMPSVRARRLCPHAVFLPGRHDRYGEVSARVMALFRSFTPLVEPISLDEAFLDVTGARRSGGDGVAIARSIRSRVQDEAGLTCSVGVAPVKFVAKLASEAAKPRPTPQGPVPGAGVVEVTADGLLAFLHPLPVRSLWGVGPATLARLERLGVATVGDLAALPLEAVTATLGDAAGRHLHGLARGVDEREVEPDRRVKSVGHEETYGQDLHDRADLDRQVVRLADAVAARLRRASLAGRTVTVKVRFGDFRTITRSTTLDQAADGAAEVRDAARRLLAAVDLGPGVRLLGISVAGLTDGGARQLALDLDGQEAPGDPAGSSRGAAEAAVDEIRERFGDAAIGPATLLGERGLRVRRTGDAPWGPAGAVPSGAGGPDGDGSPRRAPTDHPRPPVEGRARPSSAPPST